MLNGLRLWLSSAMFFVQSGLTDTGEIMYRRLSIGVAALALVFALGACTTTGQYYGGQQYNQAEIRSGVIEQITPVEIASNQHSGVGAVVGGLVGLGVGSLIGGGTGRDVAMVAGTIGGAYVGNEVQKNNERPVPGQQIIVRTHNGVLVSVTQPVDQRLFKGQAVYIEGSGEGARVLPR